MRSRSRRRGCTRRRCWQTGRSATTRSQSGANDPHPAHDHAYARQAQAFLSYDATARLAGIEQPALVLSGEADILVDRADAAALAEALPNGSLQQLPGAHAGLVEQSQAYAVAILEFLAAPVPAG